MRIRDRAAVVMIGAAACCCGPARAQALSLDVEALLVPNVGATWVDVDFVNSYTSPVVACTYNLPSSASNSATVRVRNVGPTGFDVRIQQFENSNAVTASDVHCLAVDEGAHILADGRRIEARTVLLTDAAEDGGQGGWAVLYGADPLPSGSIQLAIDEEVVAGDMSRTHTTEQVYYMAFDNNQTADLQADKSVTVYAGSANDFAIPGSDVIYTIDVESLGSSPVDQDSVSLVDSLPAEVTFYNGDIDDGGPEMGPIAFDPMSSGLTLSATDIRYSDAVAAPTLFSQCNYGPDLGYDEDVRHICFNPKGTLKAGTLETGTDFSIQFRARID